MKIFVLEDDPIRIEWFKKRFIGHEVTYVDSCTQVDQFQGPYDLICLDHDLGGRQLEDHEDNGLAFVRLINDRIERANVIIHSFSPWGAMNMKGVCEKAFIAPFGTRRFTDIVNAALNLDRNQAA
jgi:CheY-like chemotaxis protein